MRKSQLLPSLIIFAFLHILIFSARASFNHAREANPKLKIPSTSPSPEPWRRRNLQQQQQTLSSEAAGYLAAHNLIRLSKGEPALQWDDNLAKYAQDWADKRINECNPHHHSGGPYGENTLWEEYNEFTPAMVTQVWIDEEKNYDDQKAKCRCQPETFNCMCGHYTQVVWRSTQRLGCGNVTCNNDLGLLVVCSYDPPGNYVGESPFQNNNNVETAPPPPSAPPVLPRSQPPPAPVLYRSPPRPASVLHRSPPPPQPPPVLHRSPPSPELPRSTTPRPSFTRLQRGRWFRKRRGGRLHHHHHHHHNINYSNN